MREAYPECNAKLVDQAAKNDVAWIKDVVTGTRNIRGEMNISQGKPIPIIFYNGGAEDRIRLDAYQTLLEFLIRPESITWLQENDNKPPASTHLVGDMQLLVPLAGLIDTSAELARLDKEIDRKEKDKTRIEGKLGNPNFVDKAPDAVVQKEKDKLADISSALDRLREQRHKIASL